ADVDRSLGAVELRVRFEEIERRADVSRGRRGSGRLVVPLPQPAPEPLAADGPGFAVLVDRNIDKGRAIGGVKQLPHQPCLVEHVGWQEFSSARGYPEGNCRWCQTA